MASRRENIIAQFIAKGTQKFKKEAHGAARAVRDVGVEGSQTDRKLSQLKVISEQLERQHITLSLIEKRLARDISNVGQQARQTGRDLGFMGLMSTRARGGRDSGILGLFGMSSKLKDRLSLTSSEVKSVALTMGAYLSPALIELAASLSSALIGGGVVAGGGLAAFITGLSGLTIVGIQATGQISKITQAQNALNLSIAQYGAGSKQAAAANAKLLGVIQTQGGIQAWNAVRAVNALKSAWTKKTGPARASLFEILSGAAGTGQRLLPTFARQTNLNAATIRHGMSGVFSQLGGKEVRGNIVAFSQSFRRMFGPVTRGGMNLLFALFRLLRASLPYAEEWANSFEDWSKSVRRGSSDRSKLATFVDKSVDQFKAWWGLLKALGRLFRTVFRGSNEEGQQLVGTLTHLVDRFNNWLNVVVGKDGETRVERFFRKFNENLYLLFNNPGKFITERVEPFFASVIAAGIKAMVLGWVHSNWEFKLLSAGWLALQLARSVAVGRITGAAFAQSFQASAVAGMAGGKGGGLAATAAEGGILATAFGKWGGILAGVAGKAFIGIFLYQILHGIAKGIPALSQYSGKKGWGELWKDLKHRFTSSPSKAQRHQVLSRPGLQNPRTHNVMPHGHGFAAGGTIPWGMEGVVGESGMEVARAVPSGLQITPKGFEPMGAGGLRSMESILSVSDMLPPVHVHLKVERREIGKAVVDWKNDTKSRRGGRDLD